MVIYRLFDGVDERASIPWPYRQGTILPAQNAVAQTPNAYFWDDAMRSGISLRCMALRSFPPPSESSINKQYFIR